MTKVIYRAIMTRDGAMLLREAGHRVEPLPQWRHPSTGVVLPWDWHSGFYPRWMVAYSVLLDATGAAEAIALKLAARFVSHYLASPAAKGWTLTRDEIQSWVASEVARSVLADLML